jgi:low affinity Fe/Cu permease
VPKSRCRKFSKYKFTFFAIIATTIILILIIVLIYKNRKLSEKESELSETNKILNDLKSNIDETIKKQKEAKANLTSLINDLSKNQTEVEKVKSEYAELEKENDKLLYTKNDLLAQKDYISNQINYKSKSLKDDELKEEIENKKLLLKQINQRFEDLSIDNTNIELNVDNFQKFTESEILNKCFDSIVYGFHVNRFHENCDGYPLLILIKTKKGQKIGAFTSYSNDGNKNVNDEISCLINIDKNKYFLRNIDKKDCYVYSNIDEFPKFGNDLVIYRDGQVESNFPECYETNSGAGMKEFIEDKSFEIEIMEIYKLKLK